MKNGFSFMHRMFLTKPFHSTNFNLSLNLTMAKDASSFEHGNVQIILKVPYFFWFIKSIRTFLAMQMRQEIELPAIVLQIVIRGQRKKKSRQRRKLKISLNSGDDFHCPISCGPLCDTRYSANSQRKCSGLVC